MNETAVDIGDLLSAHRDGDASAAGRLLAHYRDDLWGYLMNHVRHREDAEDLFQDVCVKVMQHLHEVREAERFRSWLFSVAMNRVRDHFRKKRPVALEERDAMQLNDPGEHPRERIERREHLVLLRRCVGELPERDREVLLLDTMAGVPQKDIAEQLELNLNTVKTILRRAKIKLARMMAEAAHG
jgi:RNA polymerase sigma-70 factor (ECF subfamily)